MLRFTGVIGSTLLLGATLCGCSEAWAQSHEQRTGDYVLRSSVVASNLLPAEAARENGIEPAPNRAVLNAVVLREAGGRSVNVPAEITATAFDLNGRPRSIRMQAAVDNGMVSYIGTFDFLPREVLDFRVVASPASGGPTITLAYRDRMGFR